MTKNLVIVESPAKARTLSRFLGKDFVVEASIGHVRDLPESAAAIPAKYKKESWARLGVNVEDGFKPLYVIPAEKRAQIKRLKELLAGAETLFLATDEDREGESISWHLKEVLKPKIPVRRLVFHEITKHAILHALEEPRDIDENLVRAQEARRVVDRLYGYVVSPLLWKKIKPRLSAGRVQSVAVRLIVERERARMAFRSASYRGIGAVFSKEGKEFEAALVRLEGRRLATGKDFDPRTGELSGKGGDLPRLLGAEEAEKLRVRLEKGEAEVDGVEEKPFTDRPAPPYTTSTLQQDANRRLGFAARRTMDLAQRLYESGFITYMRTDSTTLSKEALDATRSLIVSRYGSANLPGKPRFYKSKVKNAQEAHEAIRPAGEVFKDPMEVEGALGRDCRRLYELIWKRTVASQMVDATGVRIQAVIRIDEAEFQASGKVVKRPGFLLAYGGGEEKEEKRLPPLDRGEQVEIRSLEVREHRTQPPARLTEAGLVKELEARGIGRPSTYASIIETILKREYVRKVQKALVPTFTAFAVVQLLEAWLSYLVDYGFTAEMEDQLDQVSLGKLDSRDYLRKFYFGNEHPGLKDQLAEVESKIDPREVCGIRLGEFEGRVVEVRVGRYGPFLSDGERRASLPEDLAPDELTVEKALEILARAAEGPKVLGRDPETGFNVYVKTGRYGPYVQLGDPEDLDGEKPKMASLLEGMDPESLDLSTALALLSLPRELGNHPESGVPVIAANGRYGPYVKAGKETRSIPEGGSPLDIDLEGALALLAEPKKRGRVRRRREPLKVLGEHPESGAPVRVLDGRFGPYVTDGELNASIPRGTTIEELTLDYALDLLRARAAKAGTKKRKKSAKKKTAKKSSRKKKAK